MVYCFKYCAFGSPGKIYLSPKNILEKIWTIVSEKGYKPCAESRIHLLSHWWPRVILKTKPRTFLNTTDLVAACSSLREGGALKTFSQGSSAPTFKHSPFLIPVNIEWVLLSYTQVIPIPYTVDIHQRDKEEYLYYKVVPIFMEVEFISILVSCGQSNMCASRQTIYHFTKNIQNYPTIAPQSFFSYPAIRPIVSSLIRPQLFKGRINLHAG